MSSSKIIRWPAIQHLPLWLLILGVILGSPACVWVPNYGPAIKDPTNPSFTKERRAHAETEAAKNVASRESARIGQLEFTSSVQLIDEALRPFLPPAPKRKSAEIDLKVVHHGRAFLFRPERYDISATGDFSQPSEIAFVEAVRRLQNHLRPRPVFIVHLWRDTPEGRLKIGDYEIK